MKEGKEGIINTHEEQNQKKGIWDIEIQHKQHIL